MSSHLDALGPLLAAGAILLVACGSSEDSAPGSGSQPSTEAMIADLCQKLAALPCAIANTEASCLQVNQTHVAAAQQEDCQAELAQYLKCAASHPPTCVPGATVSPPEEPYPAASSDCGDYYLAFSNCYTGLSLDECVVSAPTATCGIKCPNLSSICTGPDPSGPVDCTCDSGPRAGTMFSAGDCGVDLDWATGHHCK